MVRTLRNAFASGRIAQAYMLTGVRGVGKTTTARLIARALNYEGPGIEGPTLDMGEEGALRFPGLHILITAAVLARTPDVPVPTD